MTTVGARKSYATMGDSGALAPEFPVLHLTDGTVSATVCLPDAEKGYYRGTRFDWSGVVCGLRSGGYEYVGEWQPRHDPLKHDGLTGPADEFTQTGYEQARPGEEFLKIGVGTLRKPSGEPYDRFLLYEIVDPGILEVSSGPGRIGFRHLLRGSLYGYDYRKTLLLTGAPGLKIEYALTNLGRGLLEGYVYNHNFFTLGGMTTGTDTSIRLPFRPAGMWREPYDSVALTPDGIAFSRGLRQGESVFMGDLRGHDPENENYGFGIGNLRTGAGVEVSGSGRMSHMVFWACPSAACLEPYVPYRIMPGETARWHIDYKLLG